ncbi:MAG: hypothetical protein GY705_16850, partial [Bacteroidetes bacterium]|nr:hypothetical protein [Bacteroidota bacterium]
MRFFLKIIITFFVILFSSPLQFIHADNFINFNKTLRFDKIQTDYMLNSIMEDRDGFIWLGTQSGLVKYNGYDYLVYEAGENSIPGNWVNALFEDSEGLIWI